MLPTDRARRLLLQRLGAATLAAAPPARLVANFVPTSAGDACVVPAAFTTALPSGGEELFAPLRADRGPVALVARAQTRGTGIAPALAFAARDGARELVDPTLVAAAGSRVRVRLDNSLSEPTVVHWHGFTMDTRNDGNGEALIAPGATFDYAFNVHNRAGLYWYHPHPHGATARQVHLGLFGLFVVEDGEDAALRAALEFVPGDSERTLVLHEWRATAPGAYRPGDADRALGWFGDVPLVNYTPCPHLDVATRRYRLRIINAANARSYRLAFRGDDGALVPFHLIGTDGGLLATAVACREIFVSPAERVDVVVDFSARAVGDFVLMETLPFDPMHALPTAPAIARDELRGGMDDAHPTPGTPAAPARTPDGAAFALMQFRIRARTAASPSLPARLAHTPSLRPAADDERPLRLGFAKGRWRINDRVYDRGATPIVVARAATETWLLRNYHSSAPHAMHLHGFQFRVLSRETSPDQLSPLVVDAAGRLATDLGWKDTVLVWPGESVRLAIDFRHPFAGGQTYLFHCHNLEHEDGGMMLRVAVG